MSTPIYLDHAATTPVAGPVRQIILEALENGWGNPSSMHVEGRRARAVVDRARDRVAAALHRPSQEVVFCSGGSEADNLAVRGAVARPSAAERPHLVVSAVEHDAVLATARRLAADGLAELSVVGCDATGWVDPEAVAAAVRPETALVSVMLANNEVGTVQDVAGISALVHDRNPDTLVHSDAVQAFGKLPVRPETLGVDLLSLSAHKVYGPKGCGALWIRDGVVLGWQVSGGGHERGRRAGTENVPGVAGFGAAAELVEAEREEQMARLRLLSTRLIDLVCAGVDGVVVTGSREQRLATFASFAFPDVPGEVLLTALDRAGVCASAGSACSSGATLPSHTLAAMGLPAGLVAGALRCSLGRDTSAADVELAGAAIVAAVARARLFAPVRAG
ncbi:MAG: cysteine desulfurase family protein [Candidatus Dormibacteria bacterium]